MASSASHYLQMLTVSLLTLLSFTAALSKPATRSLEVHETRAAVPSGFVKSAPASPNTLLNLRLGLANSNTDGLITTLYDVSTPSSANYGQHLSKEEVCIYQSYDVISPDPPRWA